MGCNKRPLAYVKEKYYLFVSSRIQLAFEVSVLRSLLFSENNTNRFRIIINLPGYREFSPH